MNLRWLGNRWGLIALLVLTALMLGVFLLRGVLLYPCLKTAAVDFFQSELDLHLALGDISGSLLTELELADLQISTREAADIALEATVSRVRLSYSLTDLFQGIEAFIAGLVIAIDHPRVHIDLSRPSAAVSPGDAPEAFTGLPAILPRIYVRDGKVALKGAGYESRFGDILLSSLTTDEKNANAFTIEVGDWRWHLPPLRDGHVEARARLVVDPSGQLVWHQLALNRNVLVEKGRVDLSRLPRSVSFQAQIPVKYGNLRLNGRHDDESLQLRLAGEAVDLALIEQVLDGPHLALAGRVDVETDIRLPYDHPEMLSGAVSLRAGTGQWRLLAWEHGQIHARASDGVLTVPRAEWQGDGNTGSIQDLSLPTAALFEGQVDQLLGGLTASFDFSLRNIPSLLTLWGEDIHPAVGAPPHHLVLKGRVQQGVLTVGEGQLASGRSTVRLNRLKTDLAAIRGRAAAANLEVDAVLAVPELGDMATLLPLPSLTGRLEGELALAGSMNSPQGTVVLKGKNLHAAGHHLGDLDMVCRSDGVWLTAETLALRHRRDSVNINGRIHLESGRMEKTRGTASIADIGAYLDPYLPAGWPAAGALNLQYTVAGTPLQPDIQADFTLTKSRLGSLTLKEARGRLQASRNRLNVARVEILSSRGHVMLTGGMNYAGETAPLTADLSAFSYRHGATAMHLSAPVRVSRGPDDSWSLTPLVLAGTAGRVTVAGDLGWPGQTDLRIDLDGVNSGDWFDLIDSPIQSFSGLVARIRLAGTAASHRMDIEGQLPRLMLREAPRSLQGRFDLAVTDDGIAIRQWAWNDGADTQLTATGRLPLVYVNGWQALPGPLILQANFDMAEMVVLQRFFPDIPVVGGTATAQIDLTGTLASPRGTIRCAVHDLLLEAVVDGSPQGPFGALARLRVHPSGVDLEELHVDSTLMALQGRGRWRADDSAGPWTALDGPAPAGTLAASADVDIPDLGWIAGILPGAQTVTGRLSGALNVEGPLTDPAVVANLVLREGSLRPDGDAPPLKSLQADIQADAAGLTVRSCRGEIGGAPFELSGALQRSMEKKWVADFHLTGTNLLLYRSVDVRVRADTDLRLTGPLEKMTLKGEIGLTNGRLTRNVDFFSILREKRPATGTPKEILFSLPDPPLKDMVFDVHFTSRAPFDLRNNLIVGSLRPALHLGGTGELPLLTGDIYVDPTRMRLPAGTMTFQSGVVRFLPSRANRPEVELLGEGKVFDYDITAVIEGLVEEPRITLSSSPPLPGNELMLMLLTGQPPASENRSTTGGIPINLAVYIGQDLMSQWFERDSTETWASILDRFQVTLGRRVTRSGEETMEAEFRIGEDVFRDGDSIYITGEKDIFDFYNAGLKFVFRFE